MWVEWGGAKFLSNNVVHFDSCWRQRLTKKEKNCHTYSWVKAFLITILVSLCTPPSMVETEFRCCELIQQRIGESTRIQPMWPGFDSSLSGWACWPSSSLTPRAFPLNGKGRREILRTRFVLSSSRLPKNFFCGVVAIVLFLFPFFSVYFYPVKSLVRFFVNYFPLYLPSQYNKSLEI